MIRSLIFLFLPLVALAAPQYVTTVCQGQLGNQLFEIAAAIGYAEDHPSFEARFPQMVAYPEIFHRLNREEFPPHSMASVFTEAHHWKYASIPVYTKGSVCLVGFYQSAKYFQTHREKLVNLFAPTPEILSEIELKYGKILREQTVALHVRTFIPDGSDPEKEGFRGTTWTYFKKAMDRFPDPNTLFLIFSDAPEWTKSHFPETKRRCLFIDKNPYYIDFYLISLCKHQILSPHSTFAWWGAYLNQNREKRVIAPFIGSEYSDFYPTDWEILD